MRRLLAILLCLLAAGGAEAADQWDRLATPSFGHIGRENGLPHDIAMDFAQTPDGFVWIATQGGVARWDGYRLRVFIHVDGDPGSLPDSSSIKLLIDDSGRLWVAAASGQLARFDAATERFETFPIPGGGIGLPYGLVPDGTGGIWAGGTDGLAHFAGGKWTREEHLPASGPAGVVRCLLHQRDGSLWLCGGTGLFRRKADGDPFTLVEQAKGTDSILALFEDAAGRIWYGTEHGEVGLLDPASGTRRQLVAAQPAIGYIREFAMVGPDEVWGVTTTSGILDVDANTGLRSRITAHDGVKNALGSDSLDALMRDRSGGIWVGGLGGVYVRAADSGAVATIWPTLDPARGPYGQDVLNVCATGSGRILMGTLRAGILTVSAPNEALGITAAPGIPSDGPILDCASTQDGAVYAGLRKGMLRISEGTDGLVVEHPSFPGLEGIGAVRSLLGVGGDLWVGADSGLYRIDAAGHVASHAAYQADDPNTLSNNSIETLLAAPDGSLWVGTHNGLDRFDPKTGTAERIQVAPDEPDALPGSNLSSLLIDRRGRLWVGTIGGAGIGVLEHPEAPGKRRFVRIGTAQGLPSLNIGTLLEDDAGRIWASSTDGLIVIDPDTYKPRGLGPADGVTIRSYWVHSGIKLPDGTLLFGGLKGMTVVHPSRLAAWSFHPPVQASAVRVGGRPSPAGQPIVLDPEDRGLQVEFAALDYSAPERNRYAYRLTGYDSDWVPTDAEHRLAAYTNLPPGDYTLLLRGSNREGEWTDPPTEIPVRVLPAWHQTWWFRVLELATGLAALAGIVRLRTYSLERSRLALEREVRRRTEELARSQNKLEESNLTLAAAAEALRRLGEVGRDITANLDVGKVFASLCRNIEAMLDADSISIWLLDEAAGCLRLGFGMEDGKPLPSTLAIALDDPVRGIARTARERRETVIDYAPADLEPIPGTKRMTTALFGPLMAGERLLGVLTVQTERPHAYGERERLAFTNLCAYGATALANADTHRDLARANAELGRLASKDPLTGLANRRRFFAIASEEVARAQRYQRPLGVIMADLDEFKRVNDTYGHTAGDLALQTAALCLGQCLRGTDLAARFGGEEFVALLPETALDGAARLAERFRELLARTDIEYEGGTFRVTVSVGVSAWSPGEDGISAAVGRADVALYRVKGAGRNGVSVEAVLPSAD